MFELARRGNSLKSLALILAVAAAVCVAALGDVAADTKDVTVVGPVTVQGAVDATVVAMPPVDVHNLDNPAFSAFAAQVNVQMDPPFAGTFGTPLADPPPGTLLVIEFLGVQCTVPAGQVMNNAVVAVTNSVNGNGFMGSPFPIPLNHQGTDPLGKEVFVGALSVRMYDVSTPGPGSVNVGAARSNGTGVATCIFTLQGHLVPLPPGATGTGAASASAGDSLPPQELVLPYTGILAPEALNPPPGTIVKFEAQ